MDEQTYRRLLEDKGLDYQEVDDELQSWAEDRRQEDIDRELERKDEQ